MAVFRVANANDSGAGSLRLAILDANDPMRFPGADTIVFDGSLRGQPINLTSGQLNISDDLTIDGLGADALTIFGTGVTSSRSRPPWIESR